MEYVSIVKTIRGQYANIKFWFMAWKKEKCVATAQKIKAAVQTVKDLMANQLIQACEAQERAALGLLVKEINDIEESVIA